MKVFFYALCTSKNINYSRVQNRRPTLQLIFFFNVQQDIPIAIPHLLTFDQKFKGEPNQNIGISRLIFKYKYNIITRNC